MSSENCEVDESGTTSVPDLELSTDRPPYYSYRVTLAHSFESDVVQVLRKYSDDWCGVKHNPDADDHNPHFHFVIMDFDTKKVDAFKKAMCLKFSQKGNGFHAGKFRTNDVMEALTYFSHDPVGYLHFPHDSWQKRIIDAPKWQPHGPASRASNKRPRERLGDPTLTYSNLVKQAVLYRTNHAMDTCSLECVLDRMVSKGGWIPSRDLVTNGVPEDLHAIFASRVNGHAYKGSWSRPHEPSDRKKEWLDRPVSDARARLYHDPSLIQHGTVYK